MHTCTIFCITCYWSVISIALHKTRVVRVYLLVLSHKLNNPLMHRCVLYSTQLSAWDKKHPYCNKETELVGGCKNYQNDCIRSGNWSDCIVPVAMGKSWKSEYIWRDLLFGKNRPMTKQGLTGGGGVLGFKPPRNYKDLKKSCQTQPDRENC